MGFMEIFGLSLLLIILIIGFVVLTVFFLTIREFWKHWN